MRASGLVVVDLLLSPVAKDVGLKVGSVFDEVGADAIHRRHVNDGRLSFRHSFPLIYDACFGNLLLQVAVPVGAEVGRRAFAAHNLALCSVEIGTISPVFAAPVVLVHVGTHSASHVAARIFAADVLASQCVVHLYSIFCRGFFVHHHHLQSRSVGHQVAHVHGISVPQSRAIHQRTVVIDGT